MFALSESVLDLGLLKIREVIGRQRTVLFASWAEIVHSYEDDWKSSHKEKCESIRKSLF
jgi:hypothetical protein